MLARLQKTAVREHGYGRLCARAARPDVVPGERPMCSEKGEASLVGNTKEVYPGLVVAGLAANAVYASPRMGAIFGGMFVSGKQAAKVAREVIARRS